MSRNRKISARRCGYCLGLFRGRAGAEWCSAACRVAAHQARRLDELDPVSLRRETRSDERARARLDGIGTLTRRESYEADLRVRASAGIDPCRWCVYQVRQAVSVAA